MIACELSRLQPLGGSKGAGLSWLLDWLGVAPEQVLALGDGENDVEMLQLAGVSLELPRTGTSTPSANSADAYRATRGHLSSGRLTWGLACLGVPSRCLDGDRVGMRGALGCGAWAPARGSRGYGSGGKEGCCRLLGSSRGFLHHLRAIGGFYRVRLRVMAAVKAIGWALGPGGTEAAVEGSSQEKRMPTCASEACAWLGTGCRQVW